MDTAELIYQRLDAFTNGIEQFLSEGREEVWESDGCMPFILNVLLGRRVMFGFRNREGSPDPVFSITLAQGIADISGLICDTLLGYFKGDEADSVYAAEFLQEMIARKRSGVMRRTRAIKCVDGALVEVEATGK